MYDVEIVSSVTHIPKAEWDDLAPPDDPLWSWSYFRVMETSGVGPDGFEYLIFRRGARIVAILPAFWFGAYPLALGDAGMLEAVIGRVRKTIPGFLCLSVYFCGHPMGEGRLLRRDGEAIRFGPSLLHQVRQIAWQKGLRWIIFKDFDASAVPTLFPTLRSSTFFTVDGLPDARLDLSTTNFEDFIAASKGNARKNIRKRLRKFAGMTNLRVEVLNSAAGIGTYLMPLYERVFERAKLKLDRLTRAYFEALSAMEGIEKTFIVCYDDDRPIGFVLCLFAGQGAVCLRGGFDYEVSTRSGCYFVLQYRSIELAMLAGCRVMSFCQTTYNPKLALGCRLSPLTNVVTHKGFLARAIIRRLLPILFSRYHRVCGLPDPRRSA